MSDAIPPPKPPKGPPRPLTTLSPALEARLVRYIDEQEKADLIGTVDRLANLIMRQDSDNKREHELLRNDIRGVSLRVGVLERDRDRHEAEIDDSQRIFLEDIQAKKKEAEAKLAKAEEEARQEAKEAKRKREERLWKIVAAVSSLIAAGTALWHLFR